MKITGQAQEKTHPHPSKEGIKTLDTNNIPLYERYNLLNPLPGGSQTNIPTENEI
jgi:hypothetical protein